MSDLERLERLEQSITQLLYEIDSNFSKAHRIITNDILPIVERYAENSEQVWQHSKFWKQFFEASANVSLSGYEEQIDTGAADRGDELGSGQATSSAAAHDRDDYADSSFLSQTGPPGAQSHTPGRHDRHHNSAQSPFDLTRDDEHERGYDRQRHSRQPDSDDLDSSMVRGGEDDHETPLNRQMQSLDISSSPPGEPPMPRALLRSVAAEQDSPSMTASMRQELPRHAASGAASVKRSGAGTQQQQQRSALLHRVLDSNWKVQATPMSRRAPTGARASTSPTSSPPQMGSLRTRGAISHGRSTSGASGVNAATTTPKGGAYDFDIDDDDDDDSSLTPMSPPRTMAFSLPPSKLLRTPAKEAAKYMVDEILRTAGAHDVSSIRGSNRPGAAAAVEEDADRSVLGNGLTSRPIGASGAAGNSGKAGNAGGGGVLDAWSKRHNTQTAAMASARPITAGSASTAGQSAEDSSDWGI